MRRIIILFLMLLLATTAGCNHNNKIQDNPISISKTNISMDEYKNSTGAKVLFVYDSNGILYKFIAFGYTNYDEYGKDIVASALSSLSINTINSLSTLTDIDIKYEDKAFDDKPYLECYVDGFKNEEQQKEFSLLVESFKLGAKGIEESYGSEYVEVIEIKK